MDTVKCLLLIGIILCIIVGTALYRILRKKKCTDFSPAEVMPEADTAEAIFLREWSNALTGDARTFNGLYNGLLRIQRGDAKKPEKVLREWSQRTHYKFENQSVDTLCQKQILPLIEAEDREALTKWANLLLEAAAVAGITKEAAAELVLTDSNADAYIEWDGNELFPDDRIEIITPAWYQNGKLLEQGQCKIISAEEE